MCKTNASAMACRRLICLLLVAVLAVSPLFGGLSNAAFAADETLVYFSNIDDWSDVYGYVWDANGNTVNGDWPGSPLSPDANGLYVLKLENVSGGINFIFNNNGGSQTADLKLTAAQLTSGDAYWVAGGSGSPAVYAPPSFSGTKVTFTYAGTGSKVYVAGSFNGWSTSAAPMTKSGSVFTYTCELKPGLGLTALLVQGVATSIDALSVGFTIAEYGLLEAVLAALLIGGVTFFICLGGVLIGRKAGTRLTGKAGIFGGVILIAIGLEIFISSFL